MSWTRAIDVSRLEEWFYFAVQRPPKVTGVSASPGRDIYRIGLSCPPRLLKLPVIENTFDEYDRKWNETGLPETHREAANALRKADSKKSIDINGTCTVTYERRRESEGRSHRDYVILRFLVTNFAAAIAIERHLRKLYNAKGQALNPLELKRTCKTEYVVYLDKYLKLSGRLNDAFEGIIDEIPWPLASSLAEGSRYFCFTAIREGEIFEELREILVIGKDGYSIRKGTMGHIYGEDGWEGITTAHVFEDFSDSEQDSGSTKWAHPVLTSDVRLTPSNTVKIIANTLNLS